jgi:hypothetical protein
MKIKWECDYLIAFKREKTFNGQCVDSLATTC